MKTIKVKRLQEALSVNDPEVKRRISSLLRASKAAKEAAAKAREQGKELLADRLDKRGDELEDLANSINIDTLDSGESETHGGTRQAGQGGGSEGGHESDGSEDNDDAEDNNEKGQSSTDGSSENNIENSEQSAGERASEAANKAKQAAEEAKQAAQEAKQNAKEQGTSEAQKAAEDAESAAQEAAEAAERASQHAKAAKEAEANGDQAKAESEADKAEEAAEEAEEAAENAEDAASNSSSGDGSDDDSSDSDSEGDSKGSKGDKDDKQKGKGGDSGNNDSDDDSDSDSDDDSDGSKGSKSSKSGKSGKPSDDSDEDGDTDDMDLADDDEDESEDPFKDPFADEEDIPQLNIGSPNGKEPREATIKDIIKQINKLEGEAKRGAIQGLKDLISSRKPKEESLKLTEAKKGVRDMTDDEFGDLINSTWEMVKQVETDVEEIDDLEDKKAKINAWQNDKNALADLNQEDTMDKKKERHKIKAREKEANKYSSFKSLDDFKISFEGAIKNQIEMVLADYQTWDEINAEYESEDILMKADVQKAQLDDALPIIDIYFDQSGSWNDHHKAIGKRAIATIQKEYAEKGLCTLNIYYFDDYVTEDENARFLGHGGTNAWPHILDNIKATGAKNVVIMTDSDMNGDAYDGPTCRVDGCVWWLWKDGRNAQECVKHLIGRAGNYQFSFKSR